MATRHRALAYHAEGRRGKPRVAATGPAETQGKLSLACSPGVAEPCREIPRDPATVFRRAGEPVREDEAVLFERFVETDEFVTHRCTDFGKQNQRILGDGVVTGCGKVEGRQAFVFAQDLTVFGGSLSGAFAERISRIMDLAAKAGAPVIAQISLIVGPCAGGAAYSPAMTDFIIMAKKTGYTMITGPDVIKTATREEVTPEELGGAIAHASKSSVADFAAESEEECMQITRTLLSFIPRNNLEDPPFVPTEDSPDRMEPALRTLVPDNPNKPCDIRELVRLSVDDANFFEAAPLYARKLVVEFARFAGRSVGIVANQPAHRAGVLDIDCSKKGARFVRFCDAFNIPLITFVDVPGFLPGVDQEHGGIIKRGAKLLYAFCEATVPRVTIITRKAYGGACRTSNRRTKALPKWLRRRNQVRPHSALGDLSPQSRLRRDREQRAWT